MTKKGGQYDCPYAPADLAELRRQKRKEWLERQSREDGHIWPPITSEDDPYGDDDEEYEELE
jgi:hypothetical protein